jgi:TonB family protein
MTRYTSFIALALLFPSAFAQTIDPAAQAIDESVYKIGSGVTPPGVVYKPEPDYSEEARRKGVEGTIQLTLIVKADGSVGEVKVKRAIGHGLDEQAIAAVRTWKFRPAMKDGIPVAVMVTAEIRFQLYKGQSPVNQSPPPENIPPKLLDPMPGNVRPDNAVKVVLVVREDGSVDPKSIKFKSKVDGRTKEALVLVIQKLRFAPGTHFGVPTKAKMQLEFDVDTLMSALSGSKP